MGWIEGLRTRARLLVARREADARMEEEFYLHIDLEAEKNERAGMSPAQARQAAQRSFGNVPRHRESMRLGRGTGAFDRLAADARYTARGFRHAPGFAAAVVLTLALGLGANATMFGAVDRVLLSPPEHVQDHEELRFLHLTGLGQRSFNSPMAYSFPDYESIRDLPVLAGAAAYRPRKQLTMGSGLDARRAIVQDATYEFFPLLGILPAQGRFFGAEDDRPGAQPVAVLGHGFWDREFGRDPGVIGQIVTLASHSYEVIGVAPPGFTGANLEAVDLWVPLRMNVPLTANPSVLDSRGAWWFRVVVRLDEGVADEAAEAQLTASRVARAT